MPYALRDYLEIDEAEAIRQWRRIRQRRVPEPRKSQEDFCPVEVVLCAALFHIVVPGRFGGRNQHLLPREVMQLAATLRRSPMSLVYKMQNLAAVLKHGAKLEPEVFCRLSRDQGLALSLYQTILRAARATGLGDDNVPDFLDASGGPSLLGQDEIGSEELGIAAAEYANTDAGRFWQEQLADRETEQLVEARVRLGQSCFARQVLADYDHRCAFCGFAPRELSAKGMLIASHIKPWARCERPSERLDRRNGIAACPLHDRAFDTGLITVNGGQRIHRTSDLELMVSRDEVTRYFFGSAVLPERLRVPAGLPGPGERYLEYHNANVFRRTS